MSQSVELLEAFNPEIPKILPHEKVYSIQVGGKLFKLSGASLSSDAPSHFTDFFQKPENADKVLYIDRNPAVFESINMHLQGYHVDVTNDFDFMYLFQDSYYFSLKRLQHILSDEHIFASIGDQSFKIARSLFTSTNNYPNFFTISYGSISMQSFDTIKTKNMIRPPPQKPVTVPKRSPKLFEDLLELLRRNTLVIKSEDHRMQLIKECKYYRFIELEQQIIKHKILNNPFDNVQDIIINLNDLVPQGIMPPDCNNVAESAVIYQRPHIQKEPLRNLIFQINLISCGLVQYCGEVVMIIDLKNKMSLLKIYGKLCNKFLLVFKQYDANLTDHGNDPKTPAVTVYSLLQQCRATINGSVMKKGWLDEMYEKEDQRGNGEDKEESQENPTKKRKIMGNVMEIRLTKSLWKPVAYGDKLSLHCLAFEGVTDQGSYNSQEVTYL